MSLTAISWVWVSLANALLMEVVGAATSQDARRRRKVQAGSAMPTEVVSAATRTGAITYFQVKAETAAPTEVAGVAMSRTALR